MTTLVKRMLVLIGLVFLGAADADGGRLTTPFVAGLELQAERDEVMKPRSYKPKSAGKSARMKIAAAPPARPLVRAGRQSASVTARPRWYSASRFWYSARSSGGSSPIAFCCHFTACSCRPSAAVAAARVSR